MQDSESCSAEQLYQTYSGPQFTSREFQSFACQWVFHHQTSTPHYPQSNGRAEAAVKSMKRIVRAAWNSRCINKEKLCRALLQYRNTPSRKDGLLPAQKVYSHPIQDVLPAHHSSFVLEWQHSNQEAKQQAEATLKASQRYYNTGAHTLLEIQVGTNVAVQDHRTILWDTYGVVTAIGPQWQYHIKAQRGSVLIRNRQFIQRRVPESVPYLQYDRQCADDQETMEQNNLLEPQRSSRVRKPTPGFKITLYICVATMVTHNELCVAIKQVAQHHPKSYEVPKVLHTHIYCI